MRRLRRLLVPLALVAALAVIVGVVDESAADLENGVFISRSDRLRLIVPRGWQASDQPSYPGLLLWMSRDQSSILLTGEAFTRALFCSWPVSCRTGTTSDAQPTNYACALRGKLAAQRLRVGPSQPGPKETGAAGIPSVWFEYDDGKRFLRQAIAMSSDRAFSLILSAPTSEARATHTRVFEQVLRTLQLLGPEDASRGELLDAALGAGDATPGDSGLIDGAAASRRAPELAPAPAPSPIGPCTP